MAFERPIEDTEAFANLSGAYSVKNASIESAVMELAHGSCHDLTISLADALSQQTVIAIVDEAGMLVHSALYNSAAQLLLDANGVHTVDAAVAFWSGITRQQCNARQMDVEQIYHISGCDEESAEVALEDFSLIAEFIQEELMPAPTPALDSSAPASSKLPIRKVAALWHWGSLDASQKFERGPSYEGNLFSMSACPEAWRKICKFGGKQLHIKSDRSTLLDMNAITNSKSKAAIALKQEISDWGIAQGLLEEKTIFQVSWYDDELDEELILEFQTRSEAELEVDEDDERSLIETKTLIGTSSLLARHGFKDLEIIGVEYAVIEWAQAKFAGVLDGVYWDEINDEDRYSAPRAGMFPFDLSSLSEVVDVPEDDNALKGVSKVKWIECGCRRIEPATLSF